MIRVNLHRTFAWNSRFGNDASSKRHANATSGLAQKPKRPRQNGISAPLTFDDIIAGRVPFRFSSGNLLHLFENSIKNGRVYVPDSTTILPEALPSSPAACACSIVSKLKWR